MLATLLHVLSVCVLIYNGAHAQSTSITNIQPSISVQQSISATPTPSIVVVLKQSTVVAIEPTESIVQPTKTSVITTEQPTNTTTSPTTNTTASPTTTTENSTTTTENSTTTTESSTTTTENSTTISKNPTTTTTTSTTTTTTTEAQTSPTFKTPTTNFTLFCNGNGFVLQSSKDASIKYCSCFQDYYGLKCENKVKESEYKTTNDTSFCNGNGYVLQSIKTPSKQMCSCFGDYFGLQCEDKVEETEFQSSTDTTFCNDNGHVLQSIKDPSKKLCSCFDQYYGLQCDNKIENIEYKTANGTTFCNGNGFALESIETSPKRICSCFENFYGQQCEGKVTQTEYLTSNDTSFCNGNGYVLQSTTNPSKQLCSCFENYHGLRCEDKVDEIMMKLVFGLGIIAVILLIAAIFTGCQWRSRVSELEERHIDIKELSIEKENLKRQNLDLKRQRSPSPNRRRSPSNNPPPSYNPQQYSPMGSPNAGFYGDDDRRSIIEGPRGTTQLPNGDIILRMDEDELDSRRDQMKRRTPDNISINSADSDMVLLPHPNRMRRPLSQEIPASHQETAFINKRGYVAGGGRNRSPSPHNRELNMDNLRDFDENNENPNLGEQRSRARSLMDLRVVALTAGEAQKGESNLHKSKSIENMLTGQVHRLAPSSKTSGSSTGSDARPRNNKLGIHARQKQREQGYGN